MTNPAMSKFKAFSIDYLLDRSRHPEVPQSNFFFFRQAVMYSKFNAAITQQGAVLGFVVKDWPPRLAVDGFSSMSFTAANFKPEKLTQLEGVVALTFCTRARAFWIPVKFQDAIDLPVLGGTG